MLSLQVSSQILVLALNFWNKEKLIVVAGRLPLQVSSCWGEDEEKRGVCSVEEEEKSTDGIVG